MQNKEILKISGLSHSFKTDKGTTLAIDDVSFAVERGSFVSIVGPSGCGKSTLLRFIANLACADKGVVERHFDTLSMVFQSHAVFPWLTVRENVGFGLSMKGMSAAEQKKIVDEKIAEVGLDEFADSYPNELSGGMKQRVSVARALTVSPDILLMDEPFASLDTVTAQKLKDDVHRLWQKYKMTVVMVNHLIEDAVELSDKVIVLTAGPGTVKEVVHVDMPFPRNRRSPEFFAAVDRIAGAIEE